MRRKSPASGTERRRAPTPPADPYALALAWLSQRELSATQVRARLRRRGVPDADIATVVDRLTATGALDERRMAVAAVRLETSIRGRGPARARQKLRALGVPDATATEALASAMADVDVTALLDRALDRRLARLPDGPLDRAATQRLVAALVRQGFEPGAVFARLRKRGRDVDDE